MATSSLVPSARTPCGPSSRVRAHDVGIVEVGEDLGRAPEHAPAERDRAIAAFLDAEVAATVRSTKAPVADLHGAGTRPAGLRNLERRQYPWNMANEVIHTTLEEFERGLVGPPTPDDVSITADGRRLDSKAAVLAWWAEVAADVEAEEAGRRPRQELDRDT